jgi:hypothetical protein
MDGRSLNLLTSTFILPGKATSRNSKRGRGAGNGATTQDGNREQSYYGLGVKG